MDKYIKLDDLLLLIDNFAKEVNDYYKSRNEELSSNNMATQGALVKLKNKIKE